MDLGSHLLPWVTLPSRGPASAMRPNRAVRSHRMLIETDARFLAPLPNRGKRNQPAWVKEVAVKIAAGLKLDPDDVIHQTTSNFGAFFHAKSHGRRRFPGSKGYRKGEAPGWQPRTPSTLVSKLDMQERPTRIAFRR